MLVKPGYSGGLSFISLLHLQIIPDTFYYKQGRPWAHHLAQVLSELD